MPPTDAIPRNPPARAWWGVAVLLAGVWALFYGHFALGWMPTGCDNSLFYAPFFSLRWDQGPPLWNPYALSGASLYENLQAALLYPLRWPFFFLEDWRSYFGVFNALHYLVALAGMGILLRALGLGPAAVFAGALVYACGGHLAGRTINSTIFYACCWLPLLLYGALGVRPAMRWAATLALFMILSIGSPHLFLYGLLGYALVAWAAGGIGRGDGRPLPGQPEAAARRTGIFSRAGAADIAWRGLHLALGFLLAAPTLVPGIQRAGQSLRSQARVEDNLADSLDWAEIPRILLGGTGGSVYPEYIDKACYAGSVALFLILLLALRRGAWADRRFRCGLALVLLGVFLALGKNVGLQHLMPWIPGFNRLAGPSRALVLAALGLAWLAALGIDALPRLPGRRLAPALLAAGLGALAGLAALVWWNVGLGDLPEVLGVYARAWLSAPESVGRPVFAWLDAGCGLLLAGVFLLLAGNRPALRGPLLALAILFQLWHFLPRVLPPVADAAFFDPPAPVAFLQQASAADPARPFRVAGLDPLRFHDTDFNEIDKIAYLMPNFATLYRLEDIQGFDPLIPLRYLELFESTAGRSPYNDRIRNLTIDRPDPALFDLLNLRFVVGNPADRPLTGLPLQIQRGQPAAPVAAWDDRGTSEPVTQWSFVSLVDMPSGRFAVPFGREVARLEVEAREGAFSFPIRNGIETGPVRGMDAPDGPNRQTLAALLFSTWETHTLDPRTHFRQTSANYRGRVRFDRPLHVRAVRWKLVEPEALLYVASQAYRLAEPPPAAAAWRLVHGTPDAPAPVYEYLPWKQRAVLLTDPAADPAAGAGTDPLALRIPDAALRSAPADGVAWLERRNRTLRLGVDSPAPALLVLRELAAPGWTARLDGVPAPLLTVNGLWRAVRVPAGTAGLVLTYAPRKPLWLALPGLALLAALLVAEMRRRKDAAAP